MKEEKAAEEEKPAEEGDEKAEEKDEKKDEKDEKKLRAEKEEKPEMEQVYMSATGKAAGNCTFSMAYAESWNFTAEEQDEDAKVVSFNITVAEAAEEKAADEKAEKKE